MFSNKTNTTVCNSENTMRQIDNLGLGGGVVRGIAHIGVFEALENAGLMKDIKRISGTSVGALMGVLPALGMTPSVREEFLLNKIQLPKFKDIDLLNPDEYYALDQSNPLTNFFKLVHNVIKAPILAVKTGINFFKSGGLCNGDYIEQAVRLLIKHQTGKDSITFKELHELTCKDSKFKDLYITGVNRTDNQLENFSYETTPDMPIEKAVHMSMAIPKVYKTVIYNDKEYVDGSMYCGVPVKMFDDERYLDESSQLTNGINLRTLGICLSSRSHSAHVRDNKPYSKRVGDLKFYMMSALSAQDEATRFSYDPLRTLYLDMDGYDAHDFSMSNDKFHEMIHFARQATHEYIENYIKGVCDPSHKESRLLRQL